MLRRFFFSAGSSRPELCSVLVQWSCLASLNGTDTNKHSFVHFLKMSYFLEGPEIKATYWRHCVNHFCISNLLWHNIWNPFAWQRFLNHLHRTLWLQNLVLLCWLNIPAWNMQQLALWQNILLVNIKPKGSFNPAAMIWKYGSFQVCSQSALSTRSCLSDNIYPNEWMWLSILLKSSDLHNHYITQKSLNSINPLWRKYF